MNSFAYRVEIGAGIFVLPMLLTFIVAAVTVGFQSVKASQANPVKTLRTE